MWSSMPMDGRIPWPDVSRLDVDQMRDLMREIVNKIYTSLAKAEDPDFVAWRDFVRLQTYKWDKPKLDTVDALTFELDRSPEAGQNAPGRRCRTDLEAVGRG